MKHSQTLPSATSNVVASFSLLLLFLLLFFLSKWFSATSKTRKNLPPSPKKLPIIGNFHQLGSLPHRSLQSLAKKHGPLMLLHFASVPVVIVSSADAAKEIMKTHDLIFTNRPSKSTIPRKLLYNSKDVAFAPYGEYWRQVRGICVLQLLNNRRVQSFRMVREEEVALMVEKIRKSCSSSSLNLSEVLISLTNDVVCRVALGRKCGEKKFKELLREFGDLLGVFDVGDFVPWLAWVNRINGLYAKVEKVAGCFDDFLEGVIEEHRERKKAETNESQPDESKAKDFVDILLEIQGDDTTGFSIHRDTIKALILDIFAAGTDTTYTLLEWAMVELLRNPKVIKKLQDEVREIAKGRSTITEDDIEKMQYLKAVIKETLRLHVPIPLLVPRESTQDVKVMGYDIAAGTRVIINAWAIGRDPLSWEEPEDFQPGRFLNSSVDFKGSHFELIPFGAGRRGCPGTLFAVTVNQLALANLVHQFDFRLPGEAEGQELDMIEANGIAVRRKSPLLVTATPYSC